MVLQTKHIFFSMVDQGPPVQSANPATHTSANCSTGKKAVRKERKSVYVDVFKVKCQF